MNMILFETVCEMRLIKSFVIAVLIAVFVNLYL